LFTFQGRWKRKLKTKTATLYGFMILILSIFKSYSICKC
jgi:hypothetical protein